MGNFAPKWACFSFGFPSKKHICWAPSKGFPVGSHSKPPTRLLNSPGRMVSSWSRSSLWVKPRAVSGHLAAQRWWSLAALRAMRAPADMRGSYGSRATGLQTSDFWFLGKVTKRGAKGYRMLTSAWNLSVWVERSLQMEGKGRCAVSTPSSLSSKNTHAKPPRRLLEEPVCFPSLAGKVQRQRHKRGN